MNDTPKTVCEGILSDEINYNIDHNILAGEICVAKLLLKRSAEMKDVYEELYQKLRENSSKTKTFLKVILCNAAFFFTRKIACRT